MVREVPAVHYLNALERQRLLLAIRIYRQFAEGRFAILSFFPFRTCFRVVEKGKPLKYKVVFFGFLFKDLFFRAVNR